MLKRVVTLIFSVASFAALGCGPAASVEVEEANSTEDGITSTYKVYVYNEPTFDEFLYDVNLGVSLSRGGGGYYGNITSKSFSGNVTVGVGYDVDRAVTDPRTQCWVQSGNRVSEAGLVTYTSVPNFSYTPQTSRHVELDRDFVFLDRNLYWAYFTVSVPATGIMVNSGLHCVDDAGNPVTRRGTQFWIKGFDSCGGDVSRQSYCGGAASSCYCDAECVRYGDCCADYVWACTND